LPWSIGKDGLLRYSDSVYVPVDAAIENEILRVNHDESMTLRVDILGESAPSTRSLTSTTDMGYAENAEESRNKFRIAAFVRE
jgi:hypothetical protein